MFKDFKLDNDTLIIVGLIGLALTMIFRDPANQSINTIVASLAGYIGGQYQVLKGGQ